MNLNLMVLPSCIATCTGNSRDKIMLNPWFMLDFWSLIAKQIAQETWTEYAFRSFGLPVVEIGKNIPKFHRNKIMCHSVLHRAYCFWTSDIACEVVASACGIIDVIITVDFHTWHTAERSFLICRRIRFRCTTKFNLAEQEFGLNVYSSEVVWRQLMY